MMAKEANTFTFNVLFGCTNLPLKIHSLNWQKKLHLDIRIYAYYALFITYLLVIPNFKIGKPL
jgi:hypothetical protein